MRNITEWQLYFLAESLTRAKRLEKQREEFHEELYETIIYPSVQLDQSLERVHSHATDSQAIRIVEAKERYDRKIQREYERFLRWQDLLTWVEPQEKILLVRYFQKKKFVQPKIISRLLSKIEKRLEEEEKQIEQERTKQSIEDFKIYLQKTQAFRKETKKIDASEPFILKPDKEKRNSRQEKMRLLFTQGR